MTKSRKKKRPASGSNSKKGKIFHGLINQGSTCYLNSVLQVLFMNEEFRVAVERSTGEYIDRQLSELFDELKKGTAETVGITNQLGVCSVNKQSDAAEYFEKILMLASPQASQIFTGTLAHKTECRGCKVPTSEKENFWYLPLTLPCSNRDLQDYSVSDGIKEFFQKSELNGENQLYCENCGHKSDAVVGCEMQSHPDVLTLLLKRFELNYRSMLYIKNNCAVDVPNTLCMSEEGPTYELTAFVEHFGGLKSGHYTATIKFQDDRRAQWYEFNDSTVSRLNNNLFGLDNGRSYLAKSRSAYLLFYRKQDNDPNTRKPSTNSSTGATDNEHRDPTGEDGGETTTGEDNTAVAVPIDSNEEPPIKRRLSDKSGSTGVFCDVSDDEGEDRVPAEQSGTSHQVDEGREESRPGSIASAHDGKKETAASKSTGDKKDEMREAENAGKHSNKVKHIEAQTSFQVIVEHHKTVEEDKSPSKKVTGGEEVNSMKEKTKTDSAAPWSDELSREQVASKGDSPPRSNTAVKADECIVTSGVGGISSTMGSSSTTTNRENQSDEPNTDSKVRKKKRFKRWWNMLTRKGKRKNDEKEENLEMGKKASGRQRANKKSKAGCSCFYPRKGED